MLFRQKELLRWLGVSIFEIWVWLVSLTVFSVLLVLKIEVEFSNCHINGCQHLFLKCESNVKMINHYSRATSSPPPPPGSSCSRPSSSVTGSTPTSASSSLSGSTSRASSGSLCSGRCGVSLLSVLIKFRLKISVNL